MSSYEVEQQWFYENHQTAGPATVNTVSSTVFSPLPANFIPRNYVAESIAMFKVLESLQDPLGNAVRLPFWMSRSSNRDYNLISQVITEPAFIIKTKDEKLYFFRLVTWKINMLLEVSRIENEFVVSSCTENPSTEYISDLLKNGSLISFQ